MGILDFLFMERIFYSKAIVYARRSDDGIIFILIVIMGEISFGYCFTSMILIDEKVI